jgi:poly-gamma-glutamate synthesis protein (capsule biosynthesis protein)
VPSGARAVGIAVTSDDGGYWVVGPDGGVFSFGDARFFGSAATIPLNQPVVGMAVTPDGGGYWLVASDGGIFSFGDANYHGSTGGIHLNKPVVGMAATPDGDGYWLVASDGGIFSFGDAGFYGSAVGGLAGRAAAAIARTPSGLGYDILAVPASVKIGFGGDVNGVGRVGALLAAGGNPLAGMETLLNQDDANMINLETSVGNLGTPMNKQYTFQSPPSLLYALKAAGVTVVNLANNHSLDFGPAALMQTIDLAHAAGLLTVGAGANAAQAYAPALVHTPGGTVAFLGLSQVVPAGWAATAHGPGVASLYDLGASIAAIRAARAEADFVVVMVHWGIEGDVCPTPDDESLAASLLQAGADVVAGSHPHVLQGISSVGTGLVDFSLGDFVWYADNPPGNLTGLLSVDLGPGGTTGYEIHPARIDGTGSPQPLAGTDASSASAYIASLAPGAGACP